MENNHLFYVLQCRDHTLYAGYTNNLEKRIKLHNEGKGAKYTRGRGPVKLVFSKAYDNKSDALKAEYEFKQWRREKKEKYLINETGGTYVAAKKL
ncbi:GIY-YIG nuclease family protein [Bacillus sp. DTU_2020_1000418_1_SI_GHA_SEK_038]|uniref:GIY-YIG nuclease family protein n=1 Tax=Bacillus sp. DTU_2020_1000418_1_SI_GHA_SEK_038 TaxID=3077585 RepID=UPI0028EA88BD|nr:GIY-YIG nuclease family protein [Bacillus sp. DTU_2020_1000418_1_SI_GHA_SEK_038]WNS75534.1 GIY-YIG nuclease family protein [Bacillus sp. DTU_2020_1000418_1_SI_GHA_SEK_038]